MSKYPLCESLGLEIKHDVNGEINSYFRVADLESILQKATVVYNNGTNDWSPLRLHNELFTALLIGAKPLKQKTTLEKISDVIANPLTGGDALRNEIKKLIEADHEKN